MYKINDLYDLNNTDHAEIFTGLTYPWEVLKLIGDYIMSVGSTLSRQEYECIDSNIWIHKTCKVARSSSITGPCIIGENTEIRQCAYIRGNTIVGKNCVIGNSVELKNCMIFDSVQVPHYNYVGDSVLGYKSHLGAGSITSNLKSDRSLVTIKNGDEVFATGLKKFGAMVGDYVEVGCNSVLNPGTVIGKHSNVYPLSSVRGYVPENSIYKGCNDIVTKK